jgi:hypothetical protein
LAGDSFAEGERAVEFLVEHLADGKAGWGLGRKKSSCFKS